jgi:hypothetical protein
MLKATGWVLLGTGWVDQWLCLSADSWSLNFLGRLKQLFWKLMWLQEQASRLL